MRGGGSVKSSRAPAASLQCVLLAAAARVAWAIWHAWLMYEADAWCSERLEAAMLLVAWKKRVRVH
jgi:hypothetical protein